MPARYLGAKAEALCFGLFVSARLRNFEMAAASAAFRPQHFSSSVFQNGAVSDSHSLGRREEKASRTLTGV